MTDFQRSFIRFLYVALLLAFVIGAWTVLRPVLFPKAAPGAELGQGAYAAGRTPPGVTATGTCIVRTKPDLVEVTLSVQQSSRSAKESNDYVKSRTKKIMGVLEEGGVAPKDIQTVYYNLTPSWDSHLKAMKWGASEGLRVRVREMDKVAELVDAAVNAGANRVDRLEFTVENLDELRQKGRAEAASVARRKAEQLASSLGGELGRLISADETYPGEPRRYWDGYPYSGYYYSGDGGSRMAQSNISMSVPATEGAEGLSSQELVIQPGQMVINVYVRATYELE
jgi:uncharacterized protein YggE